MRKVAARILVVDDQDAVCELAVAVLSGAGYDVVSAANASEALSLLAQDPSIGLLFTDIVLGQSIDGFELAQRAAELRPHLKVLYATGYAWNLEDMHAAVPGSRLLNKPYRAHELLRQIAALLEDVPAAPRENASDYFFDKAEQCLRLIRTIVAKSDPVIPVLQSLIVEFEAQAIEFAIRESNAYFLANGGRPTPQGCIPDC